jgi:hypothetical protein
VLENVRQCQQHRCQEMFNKLSSQEIFLHLAGNFCHVILFTGMPYNLLIVYKSVLQVEIIHHNWLSQMCRTIYVLWNLYIHFASRKRNMSSRPDYAIVFVLDTFNTTISNLGYGIPYRFWMFRLEDALTNCKKLQHTLKVKDEKIVSLETRYKINCFTWHVYNNNNFICIQTYTH